MEEWMECDADADEDIVGNANSNVNLANPDEVITYLES